MRARKKHCRMSTLRISRSAHTCTSCGAPHTFTHQTLRRSLDLSLHLSVSLTCSLPRQSIPRHLHRERTCRLRVSEFIQPSKDVARLCRDIRNCLSIRECARLRLHALYADIRQEGAVVNRSVKGTRRCPAFLFRYRTSLHEQLSLPGAAHQVFVKLISATSIVFQIKQVALTCDLKPLEAAVRQRFTQRRNWQEGQKIDQLSKHRLP